MYQCKVNRPVNDVWRSILYSSYQIRFLSRESSVARERERHTEGKWRKAVLLTKLHSTWLNGLRFVTIHLRDKREREGVVKGRLVVDIEQMSLWPYMQVIWFVEEEEAEKEKSSGCSTVAVDEWCSGERAAEYTVNSTRREVSKEEEKPWQVMKSLSVNIWRGTRLILIYWHWAGFCKRCFSPLASPRSIFCAQ